MLSFKTPSALLEHLPQGRKNDDKLQNKHIESLRGTKGRSNLELEIAALFTIAREDISVKICG